MMLCRIAIILFYCLFLFFVINYSMQQTTYNIQQRKVILLSGEGGTAFNDETVTKYSAKLQALGVDLTTIGNGLQGLGENEIDELCSALKGAKQGQPITLLIQSHGIMKNGQFGFCLGENGKLVTSKKLFNLINASTGGKAIDIFTEACHGGGAMDDIDMLPKGSVYGCLVDKKHPNVGIDFHRMLDKLDEMQMDVTSYNLMQYFTSHFLQNRHAPSIGISGGEIIELDSFIQGLGGEYGTTTKSQAQARTSDLSLDPEHMAQSSHLDYEKIFNKVKNGDGIYAKEYGTALSIILNHKKDVFIQNEQSQAKTTSPIYGSNGCPPNCSCCNRS